jgi:ribosomal-protein-alanine N-acetyltransferase
MSALPQARVHLLPMTEVWLDRVTEVERQAYTHPWSRGNFADSLRAGYHAQVLVEGENLLGHRVLLMGVDEAHLLNITIAPAQQGRGLGLHLLEQTCQWARQQGAQMLWLEVRASNLRARRIYERYGFSAAGLRRNYYPLAPFKREDAIVMKLPIPAAEAL